MQIVKNLYVSGYWLYLVTTAVAASACVDEANTNGHVTGNAGSGGAVATGGSTFLSSPSGSIPASGGSPGGSTGSSPVTSAPGGGSTGGTPFVQGGATIGVVTTGGTVALTGGASAIGGMPAVTGGSATGGTSAPATGDAGSDLCGEHGDAGISPLLSDLNYPMAGVYDGPAIVERSTRDELIIYFAASNSGVDAATGSGGSSPTEVATHLQVNGLKPDSLLVPGTKVWLTKEPAGGQRFDPMYGAQAWAFTVRDHQGGRLLFGAQSGASSSSAAPIASGAVTDDCTVHLTSRVACLGAGSSITYASVEVKGDTIKLVHDAETQTITVGGLDYEVTVIARQEHPAGGTCADYHSPLTPSLGIQVKDMSAVRATFDVGNPPACGQGNDTDPKLELGLSNVYSSTSYDGPIYYAGKGATDPSEYDFTVPGLTSVTGTSPVLTSVQGAAQLMAEPIVGQEYWLTVVPGSVSVLREANRGSIVLAKGYGSDSTLASDTRSALGFPVSAVSNCVYGPNFQGESMQLMDAQFDADTTVRVESGTLGDIRIAGVPYRTWVWSESLVFFTIYRTNAN